LQVSCHARKIPGIGSRTPLGIQKTPPAFDSFRIAQFNLESRDAKPCPSEMAAFSEPRETTGHLHPPTQQV
jgi:hypothetical protein